MKKADFVYELAMPADDPAIRRLLAANPVPGRVVLTYEREPDYFLGCATMGHFCQVLVARHIPTGQVAAVACRSIRPLFVNGQEEDVGYIGQLRVDERFRGHWLVSNGFRFFQHLHADGRVAGYVTTIIEGNTQAQGLLVDKARRHFPLYQEVDRLCTVAVILRRPFYRVTQSAAAGEITPASVADLPAIISFLQQHSPAKQFFPVYTQADFTNSPVTRDFLISDFVLAHRQGQIVGVMGLWNQSGYKQTIVRAYTDSMRWLRPIYNIGLTCLGARPLPSPGQPIHFAYASFICISQNDPAIFHSLLQTVYNLAVRRGYAYLILGLSTRDPLLAVARRYLHISYYSRLYTVCWPGQEDFYYKLDGRIPYMEIAGL